MNLVQKQVDKFDMKLPVGDGGIGRVLATDGKREIAFMTLMRETVQPGMVCVDIGANISYATLFMCDGVGSEGKVYAIEPDPHNVDVLTQNIELNNFQDRCEVTPCAIFENDGSVDFWRAENAPNLGSIHKTKHSTSKITVDSFSLGTFLSERKYPNFVKMDAEGGEIGIFKGALEYFTKNRGTTHFLVEVHPKFYDEGENDFAAILKEYFKIGFNCKYVISTPVPKPAKFLHAGYEPERIIHTDGVYRGVYNNISNEHLLDFACKENVELSSKKIVRSFMLSREE